MKERDYLIKWMQANSEKQFLEKITRLEAVRSRESDAIMALNDKLRELEAKAGIDPLLINARDRSTLLAPEVDEVAINKSVPTIYKKIIRDAYFSEANIGSRCELIACRNSLHKAIVNNEQTKLAIWISEKELDIHRSELNWARDRQFVILIVAVFICIVFYFSSMLGKWHLFVEIPALIILAVQLGDIFNEGNGRVRDYTISYRQDSGAMSEKTRKLIEDLSFFSVQESYSGLRDPLLEQYFVALERHTPSRVELNAFKIFSHLWSS